MGSLPASGSSMDPTVHAVSRITPLVARRVRHVVNRLPGAFAGDEEAIHELRIAARRLRVVLPLLVKRRKGRRVRHARHRLRDLTRAFGESRDLDVVLPLLAARVRELGPSRARDALVRRLRKDRKRVRRHMANSVAELDPRALRRELRALVPRSDDSADAIARVDKARLVRARELHGLLRHDAVRFDPEALHHIRIRARKLRYVTEAMDALLDEEGAAPALLRQLQDDLGQLHDAHVLAEWLAARAAESAAAGDKALAAEARALGRHFRAQARKLHRAFLASRPGAALSRTVASGKSNGHAVAHANGHT
jgi:CHAD domain-containing protein